MHTTNYTDAFIEVAEDTRATAGVTPPERANKTVAQMQYEMIHEHPYEYTSDDVIFAVYAMRNGIARAEWEAARAEFFSKGQACLRTSPLAKTYGWGIHFDAESKVALYALGSEAYARLLNDDSLEHVKAMRSSR